MGGLLFDPVSADEAVARIEAMMRSGRPHYVVTPNVDFLVQAQQDAELRRIVNEADLSLCDGMPVLWASRWLNNALPERVAGSDLVPRLLELAAARGYRVFFLGGTSEASARAVARVRARYPGLTVAGHFSPPFADLLDMDAEAINGQIREARPHLLLVSFGTPKGEKWIRMNQEALAVPVAVNVGATLDFLAGTVARAPTWMRRTGTEWLFRLLQEPRRLTRRYLTGFWVVSQVLARQWWGTRSPPGPDPTAVEPPNETEDGRRQTWAFPARLDATTARAADRWAAGFLDDGRLALLDLSGVRHFDSAGMGWLLHLNRAAVRGQKRLSIIPPGAEAVRRLGCLRLSDFLSLVPDRDSAGLQSTEAHGGSGAVIDLVVGPDTARLTWAGDLHATNAGMVEKETWGRLDQWSDRSTALVIDLTGLRYLDSSGVALLERLQAWCDAQRVAWRIVGVRPEVRKTLRLAARERLLDRGAR
jgi:N-acetylglucosaminyldiphosphoundecaprenol N-acetyl-beta-D-mannosaminyltransferase